VAEAQQFPLAVSKRKKLRYLDIQEDDQFDEAQLTAWVKQVSFCPANECERPARGACTA
jgi:hypothetical protein